MSKFEKGNKIGNRFTSENQPKNSGRKPSLYKKLKQMTGQKVDYELSKEDYFNVIRYLMERTTSELKKIIEDSKREDSLTPIWVLNVIAAINGDIRYGRTTTIDSLFDRIFGKASQPIESDINAVVSTDAPDLSALSTEELLMYHSLMEKMNNGSDKK